MSNLLQAAFPAYQRSNASGTPYANAVLHVTKARTSDYVSLYQQTTSGAIALENPISADASGNFPLFIPPAEPLKLRIVSAEGVELTVEDDFTFPNALFIPAFDDFDEIRALPGGVFKRARTSRTVFVWTADSTSADDGESVLSPSDDPVSGRWIADPEAFSPNRNLPPAATDYTLRPDGTALQAGDNYYNTGSGELRFYTGSAWGNQASSAAAAEAAADRAEAAETGTDDNVILTAADRTAVAADKAEIQGSLSNISSTRTDVDQLADFGFHQEVDDFPTVLNSEDGFRVGYYNDDGILTQWLNGAFGRVASLSDINAGTSVTLETVFVQSVDESELDPLLVSSDNFRVGGWLPNGTYSPTVSTDTGAVIESKSVVYIAGATQGVGRKRESGVLQGNLLTGQSFASSGTFAAQFLTTDTGFSATSRMMSAASGMRGPMYSDEVSSVSPTGLVPLASNTVETVLPGFAHRLQTLEVAEFGEAQQWVHGGSANSGQDFTHMNRGSIAYNGLLDLVKNFRDLAEAEGRTYYQRSLLVAHGSTDQDSFNSLTKYFQHLRDWQESFSADVMDLLPYQTEPPLFIFTQLHRSIPQDTRTNEIAAAQLEYALAQPSAVWGGTWYQHEATDTVGDNRHPSAEGMYHKGEDLGEVAFRALYDTTRPPVYILEARRTAAQTIRLKYGEDIALDTSGAIISMTGIAGTNGYELFDADGTEITISSMAVVADGYSRNRFIDLTLASAPSSYGVRLDYAVRSNAGSPKPFKTEGSRGCCYATDDAFTSNLSGGKSMRRWAAHQSIYVQ